MHLNQIKSFITVSQVLNFTNAARQNGVPQSTISRQINDLEQQLGVKLFYRTKRDVRLTQEGRAFLPYAQEILDAAKKGAFAVRQLHEGAEGRLSIATIDDSDQFLAMCLQEFSRKYPGIIVDLTYVSHGEPLQSEVDDPYDFHFHYLDMIPDSEEYEIRETHTTQLCFVSPKTAHTDMAKPDDDTCFVDGLDLSSLPHQKFILDLGRRKSHPLYADHELLPDSSFHAADRQPVFRHKIGTAVRRLRSGDLHPAAKSSRNPLSPSTDRNTSNAYRR